MGLSATEELGRIIAQGINNTTQLKEDVFPSDTEAAMLLAPFDKFKITLEVTGTKFTYDPTSFILDHPLYGELDSATLKLDGGYADAIVAFTQPATFPLTFNQISEGSTVVFTYNS